MKLATKDGLPAGLTRYPLPSTQLGLKLSKRQAQMLDFVEERGEQSIGVTHLDMQAAVGWNSEAASLLKNGAAREGAELYVDKSKLAHLWYIRRGEGRAS